MPRDGRRRGWGQFAAVLGMASLAWCGEARADVLVMRGGGSIVGELVEVADQPELVEVYTEGSDRPYLMRRDRIAQVKSEATALDAYLDRRDEAGDSAEAQLTLGKWCDEQGLTGPAQVHYRRAVELDDSTAEAHEKLGHVYHNGAWMTFDEVRRAQGLVQRDGQWITPERNRELDDRERLSRAQQSWARRIELMLKKYYEGTPPEHAEAERQLRAIADPEAVVPLVNRLGYEAPELRMLLAEVVGAIDDPIALKGLVHRVIREPDEQIRRLTLDELARRRDPKTTSLFLEALGDDDPERVGRAAWGLAGLDVVEAVPKLVPRLVNVQKRIETVYVPSSSASYSGVGGFTAGFSRAQDAAIAADPAGAATRNNFNTYRSVPVLTGPAVAPGAVAYGVQATGFPTYATTGPVVGGSAGGAGFVPRQVVRSYLYQNVEVLSALERLTGVNLGFDVDAWRRWLQVRYRPPEGPDRPERFIPQP